MFLVGGGGVVVGSCFAFASISSTICSFRTRSIISFKCFLDILTFSFSIISSA